MVFHLKTKQDVLENHRIKVESQRRNHESLMLLANMQTNDLQRRKFLRAAEKSLDRWRWLEANPPRKGERSKFK